MNLISLPQNLSLVKLVCTLKDIGVKLKIKCAPFAFDLQQCTTQHVLDLSFPLFIWFIHLFFFFL